MILSEAQQLDGATGIDPTPTTTTSSLSQEFNLQEAAMAPKPEAYIPPGESPPTVGIDDPNPDLIPPPDSESPPIGDTTGGTDSTRPSVQDLYPDMPELGEFDVPDVPDATGSNVTEADLNESNVATPTDATSDTSNIIQGAVDDIASQIGTGEQTGLTAEQQVDAELARILGKDSPLLASARQEAMRMMNARGLTNTSMAAGATYKSMVDAAMPMAQQNAQQAFQRESANTQLRQQANELNAEQTAQLRALEAELGQDLSIFNADQLAQAERLTAQLRSAAEQGNAQAYNEAAMQLADLQRSAEEQQANLTAAGEERQFLERQAYQEQILDSISKLNQQYMVGEQNIDLQHVIGTYQQIVSINTTAATLMDSYLKSIGSIFATKDMSTSQSSEAIRQMVAMLEGSMRMISEMNGMDFGDTDLNIPGGAGGGGVNPTEPPISGGDGSVNSAEDFFNWWNNR